MPNAKKKIEQDLVAKKAATDPTSQPQATTQADVDSQDAKTRAWQSLETAYGQRIDESNKAYEQNKIAADMAALQRGMGRSSYALQTAANIDQQKATAADRIRGEMIADYQNRASQIDQQELENQRYEQQWAYQQERDKVADKQWKLQFDAQQEQFKQQFEYNKMSQQQQLAYNSLMNMLEAGDNPSDALLSQAGLSRHDYEQMKKAIPKRSSGGSKTANWKQLGFKSKAEYDAYIAKQKGDSDAKVIEDLDKESFWYRVGQSAGRVYNSATAYLANRR